MEPPIAEPPAPTASPFNPAARPAAKGACSKPLILGCLGLVILSGLCLVGFFVYASTHLGPLLQFQLRTAETGLFAQMPKDVPALEQQRLRAAFAAARRRAGQPGQVREIAEASQPLQIQILHTSRKGTAMTRKDIAELTAALEEFAKTGSTSEAR